MRWSSHCPASRCILRVDAPTRVPAGVQICIIVRVFHALTRVGAFCKFTHGGFHFQIYTSRPFKITRVTAGSVCHTLRFAPHLRAGVRVSPHVCAWSAWTRVDAFSVCWTMRVFHTNGDISIQRKKTHPRTTLHHAGQCDNRLNCICMFSH